MEARRLGNQNDPRADYGPDYQSRPNRLVANFVYLDSHALSAHFTGR